MIPRRSLADENRDVKANAGWADFAMAVNNSPASSNTSSTSTSASLLPRCASTSGVPQPHVDRLTTMRSTLLCTMLDSTSNASSGVAASAANGGGSRKRAESSKLLQLLKKDLKLANERDKRGSTSPTTTAFTSSASGNTRRKLKDQHAADIEQLLISLHSTEFVGTVDPRYHSRYVSTPGF